MERPTQHRLFDRLIAPGALFLGVALAFAACALGGLAVSRQNHFKHFERFHAFTSPQSLFYPTACQVRQLAQSRLDPARIAVVVGGSSILQGSFQPLPEMWTRQLQALLGEQYQVINFGFPGARTAEFGAVAAEFLARDHPRLILITDLPPGFIYPDPDGCHFKYFYWDAHCRGWLLPHEDRDRRLRQLAGEPAEPLPGQTVQANQPPATKGEQQRELRDQMWLNRVLSFNDLWSTLACTRFCTVWSPITRESFTRPRRLYPDSEQAPPPGHRPVLEGKGVNLRYDLECLQDPDGAGWKAFIAHVRACFPEPARPRTLMLITWFHPGFLEQLSAAEQTAYARVSRRTADRLEALGFAALEIGQGYPASTYVDFCHLGGSGGARMAAAVAPRVRELARQLGYVR